MDGCWFLHPWIYLRRVAHVFNFNCGSGPDNGHETALELASGANLGRSASFFKPTRWNGSRGRARPETGQRPQTNCIFHYLFWAKVSGPQRTGVGVHLGVPQLSRPGRVWASHIGAVGPVADWGAVVARITPNVFLLGT
jgi:hypothetical protein